MSGSIKASMFANDRFTMASTCEALEIAAAVCWWNLSWLSTMMPRFLSSEASSSAVPFKVYAFPGLWFPRCTTSPDLAVVMILRV